MSKRPDRAKLTKIGDDGELRVLYWLRTQPDVREAILSPTQVAARDRRSSDSRQRKWGLVNCAGNPDWKAMRYILQDAGCDVAHPLDLFVRFTEPDQWFSVEVKRDRYTDRSKDPTRNIALEVEESGAPCGVETEPQATYWAIATHTRVFLAHKDTLRELLKVARAAGRKPYPVKDSGELQTKCINCPVKDLQDLMYWSDDPLEREDKLPPLPDGPHEERPSVDSLPDELQELFVFNILDFIEP